MNGGYCEPIAVEQKDATLASVSCGLGCGSCSVADARGSDGSTDHYFNGLSRQRRVSTRCNTHGPHLWGVMARGYGDGGNGGTS